MVTPKFFIRSWRVIFSKKPHKKRENFSLFSNHLLFVILRFPSSFHKVYGVFCFCFFWLSYWKKIWFLCLRYLSLVESLSDFMFKNLESLLLFLSIYCLFGNLLCLGLFRFCVILDFSVWFPPKLFFVIYFSFFNILCWLCIW